MKKTNYYLWGMIIGVVLAIIGFTVSNMVKTNYGTTTINEVNMISPSGFQQSMNVYIPQNVTVKNPAPTIIVQHGGNNSKEEMKLYCTELSRRGYVVIKCQVVLLLRNLIILKSMLRMLKEGWSQKSRSLLMFSSQ